MDDARAHAVKDPTYTMLHIYRRVSVGVIVLRKFRVRRQGLFANALSIEAIAIREEWEGIVGSDILEICRVIVRMHHDETRMHCVVFAQCIKQPWWDPRLQTNRRAARAPGPHDGRRAWAHLS